MWVDVNATLPNESRCVIAALKVGDDNSTLVTNMYFNILDKSFEYPVPMPEIEHIKITVTHWQDFPEYPH